VLKRRWAERERNFAVLSGNRIGMDKVKMRWRIVLQGSGGHAVMPAAPGTSYSSVPQLVI
jgi:hypothetical protein